MKHVWDQLNLIGAAFGAVMMKERQGFRCFSIPALHRMKSLFVLGHTIHHSLFIKMSKELGRLTRSEFFYGKSVIIKGIR